MSEAGITKLKNTAMGLLTAVGILTGAISLTYAMTLNAFKPRVDLLESQSRENSIWRAEMKTTLEGLVKSVDKLDGKFQSHIEAINK